MLQRSSPAFTVYVDEVSDPSSVVELVCGFLFPLTNAKNKIPAIKTNITPNTRLVYESVNLILLKNPFIPCGLVSFAIFLFRAEIFLSRYFEAGFYFFD